MAGRKFEKYVSKILTQQWIPHKKNVFLKIDDVYFFEVDFILPYGILEVTTLKEFKKYLIKKFVRLNKYFSNIPKYFYAPNIINLNQYHKILNQLGIVILPSLNDLPEYKCKLYVDDFRIIRSILHNPDCHKFEIEMSRQVYYNSLIYRNYQEIILMNNLDICFIDTPSKQSVKLGHTINDTYVYSVKNIKSCFRNFKLIIQKYIDNDYTQYLLIESINKQCVRCNYIKKLKNFKYTNNLCTKCFKTSVVIS